MSLDYQTLPLWREDSHENPAYLSSQLITCIGNKRALLGHLAKAIADVKTRLGKKRLRMFDAFAGSGVVSRFFKQHAEYLVSNDCEKYAATVARCYLSNHSDVDLTEINNIVEHMNNRVDEVDLPQGFIEELYAPNDEQSITKNDRVFYTKSNARRLDNYRRIISEISPGLQQLLLGPLLSEASIHANTAGVFKGFYKDGKTGLGRFGGSNGDALKRIKGEIRIDVPILSQFECDVKVYQKNVNDLVGDLPAFDIAYIDPPYNQHPYGSNYFMLNLLIDYVRPINISRVSGIPTDWQRSDYNVRSRCLSRFAELINSIDAAYLLISFNNEGFISPEEMQRLLTKLGRLETIDIPYTAFRGSRNFERRSIHVTEHLFLVERA